MSVFMLEVNIMSNKEPVYLTQQGLDELKKELDELINVKRPENIQAIKEARALGDLSENADYDAARAAQAQIEARIKELEYRLEHSEIASSVVEGEVTVGSTVTVMDEDDEERNQDPFPDVQHPENGQRICSQNVYSGSEQRLISEFDRKAGNNSRLFFYYK